MQAIPVLEVQVSNNHVFSIQEKRMKKPTVSILTLTMIGCAAVSGNAMATELGWYGGLNVGRAKAKIDNWPMIRGLNASGLGVTGLSNDDRDTGYKIFGGYKFNNNFALEAGSFDLGRIGYTATTTPAGTFNGSTKIRGLHFDALAIAPLGVKLSAFGKLGLQYSQAKSSYYASGAVATPADPNPREHDVSYKSGLGLQYDFTDSVGLRGEWERYRMKDVLGSRSDIDMLSVGLVVQFGNDAEDNTSPTAAARVPVAAEDTTTKTAEPPRWVTVPVQGRAEQYCNIVDLNFPINREDIQNEEKEKLKVLGTFLEKYPRTTAVIEGHTDNVGNSDTNLALSQKRAESVVNYLLDGFNVDPSRLSAVGYGESRPIADNSTEEGKRINRRIGAVIACAKDIVGLAAAPARMTVALEMEFDPLNSEIEPQYHEQLRKVANYMTSNPSLNATVEGHSARYLGTGLQKVRFAPDLALEISEKRAQNVVNYLADKFGIDRSRLAVAAFGETHPTAYGTTLETQQENHRVNIVFSYPK